ncbi:MAG: gamma-glutamyl-gamma-aminobutyrate hydrolase family protein [Thermoleophilaceae bacterium]|nr:gamma-glutamyl-gamma-aminobutyrate hydrolase family protein [Thermoleophilaceae bacterium]
MSSRPLIGVTTSEMRVAKNVEPTPQGEPPSTEMALGLSYLKAIEAAGGLPLVIPPMPLAAIIPLVDRLHGLCLSGGPDLDPVAYGAAPHAELGPTEPDLDRFELELAREAHGRDLPILAICRGAQLLNVATGGTLFQHLPDRTDGTVDHRQTAAADAVTHLVDLAGGSITAGVVAATEISVNSFHHQAVDRLGRGLLAVGWSSDGVVEAIEAPGKSFVLGVQWHAECLAERPEQKRLFSGLVEASQRYASMPTALAA